jgi:hypothetical protein
MRKRLVSFFFLFLNFFLNLLITHLPWRGREPGYSSKLDNLNHTPDVRNDCAALACCEVKAGWRCGTGFCRFPVSDVSEAERPSRHSRIPSAGSQRQVRQEAEPNARQPTSRIASSDASFLPCQSRIMRNEKPSGGGHLPGSETIGSWKVPPIQTGLR